MLKSKSIPQIYYGLVCNQTGLWGVCFSVFVFSLTSFVSASQEDFLQAVAKKLRPKLKVSLDKNEGMLKQSFVGKDKQKENDLGKANAKCPFCLGTGIREVAGQEVPCSMCGANKRQKAKSKTSTKEVRSRTPEERLPWDPAHSPSDPLPDKNSAGAVKKSTVLPSVPEKIVPLRLSQKNLTPAVKVIFNTLWGQIPLARHRAFQAKVERGPGFSIKVPEGWDKVHKSHPVLGGTQYRFVAQDKVSTLVVAVFPLSKKNTLISFLARKQIKLLSSFKNIETRNVIMGRRKGLGCYYQGILQMQDVGCNLFFSKHKGKGYMIYAIYFSREMAEKLGEIMNSLRIF